MRKSEYYGVNVPELGDRADITVVSQAIIDSENNQSGKVENMKATVSGTIISLTSETRQDALLKYYNGLAIQFISPVDASAGSSYKIKIGSLTEQSYNNKVDIKVGDIVQAIYGSTGFVSANTPIPRSSSVSSNSETTVATSKAVKQAYDKGKEGLDKANTKLDAGAVSVDYNTGKKIEDKIKEKLDKTAVINDLTTGGADKALSGEMGKKLNNDKQNKTDNDLQTDSKEIVGAINESLWRFKPRTFSHTSTSYETDIKITSMNTLTNDGIYISNNYETGASYSDFPQNLNNICTVIVTKTTNGRTLQMLFSNVHTQKSKLYFRVSGPSSTDWDRWSEVLLDDSPIFLGNAGMPSIRYIQDAGEKTAGNGYVDKTTGQLYLCKTTTTNTSVTSNFVLATNIEIAKRQHFTKTILFDKPRGHGSGAITLSDNWENYDEFIVYGSNDNADHVGSHRFKKEDIEYSISKNQRYMIYTGANDYWLTKITTGSKTWAYGDKYENCAIFTIIGIKYGG